MCGMLIGLVTSKLDKPFADYGISQSRRVWSKQGKERKSHHFFFEFSLHVFSPISQNIIFRTVTGHLTLTEHFLH